MTNLVEFIKKYALDHYEDGGWDVIVECWEDKDISEHLADAEAVTELNALHAFQGVVGVWADRQAEAAQYRDEY